jgi:glyoxylase-like metal-dependent hydrolase (beta-lactamase superfamily II)
VQIEVGLLQNFCEILYCPETRVAAIVDPAWEVDTLLREAKRAGLKVELALITHTHNDHIEGVDELVREDGRHGVVNPREAERVRARGRTLADASTAATSPSAGAACAPWRRAATPWAAPATSPTASVVTGDVLFVGGCGRTDFPAATPRECGRACSG